jgi:hypothetical protein
MADGQAQARAPLAFELGEARLLANPNQGGQLRMPPHHLLTHGVVVGMTGSGKTGLVTVLAEEALRNRVPVLVLDVKGDLPNLLLAFPSFDPACFEAYADAVRGPDDTRTASEICGELAAARQEGLEAAGISEPALRQYNDSTSIRVITPGSTAGEPLHLLSSLERRSPRWDSDRESARSALDAAVSLVLRLLGRESDPVKSREHVLLATFAERRLVEGGTADIASLLEDVEAPPVERIGAMEVDAYLSKNERHALAAALNSLLASSSLASWRQGATLDIEEWLTQKDGRTPAVILSVAHLDDDERTLVLGVVLEEVLSWVRSLPGSQRLRAMVMFDEVYGFLPPHPANPPTKRPIVALMKQARAFGVGVVLATQNPMDLDYRALGNAGMWCIGRLQTDADRARVVEGLTGASVRGEGKALANLIKKLAPRWFLLRDTHADGGPVLLNPRFTMSWMRGPMTRNELKRAAMIPCP